MYIFHSCWSYWPRAACRISFFVKSSLITLLIASVPASFVKATRFAGLSSMCLLAGLIGLAGCGGGGGGLASSNDGLVIDNIQEGNFDINDIGLRTDIVDGSASDTFASDEPSFFETTEYFGNAFGVSPLDVTKFSDAYARGWTGKGSLIVIADTGIDADHPDLADNIKYSVDYSGVGINDNNGHGSHVAGIVAAVKNNLGMHGAAFDADLAVAKVTNGWSYSFQIARQAAAWGRDLGAVAINMSAAYLRDSSFESTLVGLGKGSFYSTHSYHGVNGYYNSRGAAYQWKAALGSEQVLVKAAGNDGTSYSAGHNQLATATDDDGNLILNGQILIVGNWDSDGEFLRGNAAGNVCVTWQNGACRDAAKIQDVFIMAPGTNIYSTYMNGDHAYLTGTSMAAPMVSGALAVVHQMWPHMTGANLVRLLLVTADKTIDGYNVTVHGQGLLDMEKATQPYGAVGIPTTGRISGNVMTVSGGGLISGASAAQFSALSKIMVLDDFERDFYVNLTSRVLPVDTRRSSVAKQGGATNHYATYFAPSQHASVPITLNETMQLTLGAGMAENEFLGNKLSGSFGQVRSSTTAYMNFDYQRDLFGLDGFAQLAAGLTRPKVETADSLLTGASSILSSSWTMGAELPLNETYSSNKTKIGFALSQPVTIEQGHLDYRIPVGRTRTGAVVNQTHAVDLKPGMRELDIASYYDQSLFDGAGHLRLYAEARRNLASSKNHRETRVGLQFLMPL